MGTMRAGKTGPREVVVEVGHEYWSVRRRRIGDEMAAVRLRRVSVSGMWSALLAAAKMVDATGPETGATTAVKNLAGPNANRYAAMLRVKAMALRSRSVEDWGRKHLGDR